MASEKGRKPAQSGDGKVKRQLATLTDLLRRQSFLAKLGAQYGDKRDIYAVAGYPKELTFDHYWAMYERGDVAGRVVDMMAQTTWRQPPEIVDGDQGEGEGESSTEFTKAFEQMRKRLRLWSMFERVDRLSGVGRYAVIMIGARGTEEDAQLGDQMPQMQSPDDVLYLGVYHEGAAVINSWVTDPADPRFGLPYDYRIDFSAGVPTFSTAKAGTIRVHHSRVIHVAEDRLLDNVYGRPRLQRVYNRLMDLDKIAASTGESFWQLASRILAASTQNGALLDDTDAKELGGQLEDIIHDLRRIFVGQNVDLKWLESTPPDPGPASEFILSLVAGAAGLPKRILFGSETGERASEQDQRHFLGLVRERQERFAEPDILRAFVDRLVDYGALPPPQSGLDGYEVTWPELIEMSELEAADANLKRAQVAATLTPVGGDPMAIVEVDEDRNVWLRPSSDLPNPDELQHAPPPPQPIPDSLLPKSEEDSPPPGDQPPGQPDVPEDTPPSEVK